MYGKLEFVKTVTKQFEIGTTPEWIVTLENIRLFWKVSDDMYLRENLMLPFFHICAHVDDYFIFHQIDTGM